jgi:hypothetical protein
MTRLVKKSPRTPNHSILPSRFVCDLWPTKEIDDKSEETEIWRVNFFPAFSEKKLQV